MPDHPPSETLERKKIAEHLDAHRGGIVEGWLKALENDTQIPSTDRLTVGALRDHFPEMLGELIAGIQQGDPGGDEQQVRHTGREHGKARWRHGYRLNEVLRELARIRDMVLDAVSAFCRSGISDPVLNDTVQSVRLFFDTIVASSAQQFVDAQQTQLELRAGQLQHAYDLVQAAAEQRRPVAHSRLSLLRAINHELRNAIDPVHLTANLLLAESGAVERQALGERLSRVSARLQTLLDRLRELSMLLAGEVRVRMESIHLNEFMRELEEAHRASVEKRGLQFECSLSIDREEVTSDCDKLREIAANLLSNSIQFTTTGFVRLEIVGADNERWILRISDSGQGIDPKEASKLFKELHMGEGTEQKGARLGLIITRHLAHLLDGEVTFRSELGKGACFEVDLPRLLVSP